MKSALPRLDTLPYTGVTPSSPKTESCIMISSLRLPSPSELVGSRSARDPAVLVHPSAQEFRGGEVEPGDSVPILIARGPSYMLTMMTWGSWPERSGRPEAYSAFAGNCLVPVTAFKMLGAVGDDSPTWIEFENPLALALAGSLHPALGTAGASFSVSPPIRLGDAPVPAVVPRTRWNEWLDNTRRMKPLAGEEALSAPGALISAVP